MSDTLKKSDVRKLVVEIIGEDKPFPQGANQEGPQAAANIINLEHAIQRARAKELLR